MRKRILTLFGGAVVTVGTFDRSNRDKQRANVAEVVRHHDFFGCQPFRPSTSDAVSLILEGNCLRLRGGGEACNGLQVMAPLVRNAYCWSGVAQIGVEVPHLLLADVDNVIERTVFI